MSAPTQKEISIPWPGKSAITVTVTAPPKTVKPSGYGLILGPGAGGDEKTPLLAKVANEVAKQGHYCARYRVKVPNLGFRVSVCSRVLEYLFHPSTGLYPLKGCFLGGHSMGTRVAGTVAAQLAGNAPLSTDTSTAASSTKKNTPAKGKGKKASPAKKADASSGDPSGFPDNFVLGLILFSYPLHTADNTKALRDQILYDIPVSIPTLFVSGLKDTMCRPVLFEKVFKDMKASPREVVQVLEADHGLGFGSSKAGVSKKGALIDAIAEWASAFVDETIESVDKDKKGKGKGKAATAVMKKKAELKKTGEEWTVVVSTTA